MKQEDLTGQTFKDSRWAVLSYAGKNKHGQALWLCRCSCPLGTEKVIAGRILKSGGSKSCGCLNDEVRVKRLTTHGYSRTPIYKVWTAMIQRCYNPKSQGYADYGKRGITVCERWKNSVEAFIEDMGERPEGTSLHRINNDGNYEPGNCKWADWEEQNRHTRQNRLIPFNGKMCCIAEVAKILGFEGRILYTRIYKLGWSIEKATSTPVRPKKAGVSQSRRKTEC
jgi:hypothetical protein